MDSTHIKVGIVLLDHFPLVSLPKLGLPLVAVFSTPLPVGLPHFPIGANHFVAVTKDLPAAKFVAEIKRYLFQFGLGSLIKQ